MQSIELKSQEDLQSKLRIVEEKLRELKMQEFELESEKSRLIQEIYNSNKILPMIHPRARNILVYLGMELDSDVIRFLEGDITVVKVNLK